jgi:hypothetical protein
MSSQAASFTAGTTDRLSLAQANADYQTSAIDHLNAVVQAQQAVGVLEDSMQRPLSPTVLDGTMTEAEVPR